MNIIQACLYSTLVFLLPVGMTNADQNDSRLNDLFLIVQQTDDQTALANAEEKIWAIWYEHENQQAQEKLAAGSQAMNQNKFLEALLMFNELIKEFPDFAEGWNRRATLYYLMGDYIASTRDIEKTLALEPRHFGALSGLGQIYLAQNMYFDARSAFEEVLLILPNSAGVRQNLKMINDHLRRSII